MATPGPVIGALDGHEPDIHPGAWVAPTATVIGRVSIGAGASVWYGTVIRGDDERIVLEDEVNVQDGCILHADEGKPTILGRGVTLGHGAVVHGAVVEAGSLIGIRAVVLNGAHIGAGSLVAAGAVVTPGTKVAPGSVVMGTPGRVRRRATESDRQRIARTSQQYVAKAGRHRDIRWR